MDSSPGGDPEAVIDSPTATECLGKIAEIRQFLQSLDVQVSDDVLSSLQMVEDVCMDEALKLIKKENE